MITKTSAPENGVKPFAIMQISRFLTTRPPLIQAATPGRPAHRHCDEP